MDDEHSLESRLVAAVTPAACQLGNILERNKVPCREVPLVSEGEDTADVEHRAERGRFRLRNFIRFRRQEEELARCELRIENGLGSHAALVWHGTTRRWTLETAQGEPDPTFDAMLRRIGMPQGSFFLALENTSLALGAAFRMTALFMATTC